MSYTIKQVADLTGLSTRTLRYYGQIELLKPAWIADNGYRYYDDESLLTLQQILFYREMDVPLKQIRQILYDPEFDPLNALEEHRCSLLFRAKRLEKLIQTIDVSIRSNLGELNMKAEDYFDGFDESEYQKETGQRWGETRQYNQSNQRWNSYSHKEKDFIKQEGARLIQAMVGKTADTAPQEGDVQKAVGEYLAYINKYFYDCDLDCFRNLADMWVSDERFAQNFEKVRAEEIEFARQAVDIYCKKSKSQDDKGIE